MQISREYKTGNLAAICFQTDLWLDGASRFVIEIFHFVVIPKISFETLMKKQKDLKRVLKSFVLVPCHHEVLTFITIYVSF